MPFDTTYTLINNSDSSESFNITLSGGKDTVIKITEFELNELTLQHPETKEAVNQYWRSTSPFAKADKEFSDTTTVIATVLFITFILIGYRIHTYWPLWKDSLKKMNAVRIILLLFAILINYLFFAGNSLMGWPSLVFTLFVINEFRNELLFPNAINLPEEPEWTEITATSNPEPVLKYEGTALYFSDTEIENALIKRFPYYSALNHENRERFIHRVKNFITDKTFFIHDESGFKEMPILISASAIQLTFGFKKYLLPYFKNIHVYPEEFFRANDLGVCFLAGNVSGNNINLSWKHFLFGYQDGTDGQNVGLHELAHALYYQAMVVNKGVDEGFNESYDQFANHGNKVYDLEMNPQGGLYTEYANKNFQEFWAESAEIFFERPQQLKDMYPNLFETLKELFNQDPLNSLDIPLR